MGKGSSKEVLELYSLQKTLATGTFATVKKAVRKLDGLDVVIKAVPIAGVDADRLVLVHEEVQALRPIDHPHCVKLVDVLENQQHLYLVFEYLKGGALLDKIADMHSEARVAATIQAVNSAICHLHGRGLVHGRLTPDAIRYASAGPQGTLKVTGFELSKSRQSQSSPWGLAGLVAPEVLNQQLPGPQVDVWSMGVILHTLLVGFPPFYHPDTAQQEQLIKLGECPLVGEDWQEVSADAKALVAAMLAAEPTRRITPAEIAQHAWVNGGAPDTPFGGRHAARLRLVQARARFRRRVKMIVVVNRVAAALMELDNKLQQQGVVPARAGPLSDPYKHLCGLSDEQRLAGVLGPCKLPPLLHGDLVPVVLVPGLLASHLGTVRQSRAGGLHRHRHVFLTLMENFGAKADLSLPYEWAEGRQLYNSDPLFATSVLTDVGHFPVMTTHMKFIAKAWPKGYHYAFAYDWRRDNNETIDLCILFLEAVTRRHGRPPMIMAHSNGAYVTMGAINERPELAHSVIFMGGVCTPGVNLMHDLHHGWGGLDHAWLPHLLSAPVVRSHPCYYSLVRLKPHPEEHIDAEPGALGEVATWEAHQLGVFRDEVHSIPVEKRKAHLQHCLEAAARAQARTAARDKAHYRAPMCAIASKSWQVPVSLFIEGGNVRTGKYEEGDTRCTVRQTRPEGFTDEECPIFFSDMTHMGIPNDLVHLEQAIRLMGQRGSGTLPAAFSDK